MSVPQVLLIFAIVWIGAVAACWLFGILILARGPGRNATTGLLWWVDRIYCRFWHRPTYTGVDLLPTDDKDIASHGGLIVIANHTGSIDPLVIQARCHFVIRWMMASDMMGPQLDWLWNQQQMIPVARDGKDSGPLREAIRHVKAGEAVGIFPEGRITVPPGDIRPFMPGVGLIIAKTKAPVLLAWVSGTPDTNDMGESLTTRSNTRVEFIDLIKFEGRRHAAEIAEELRRRIAEASGWPLNNEVIPRGGPDEG